MISQDYWAYYVAFYQTTQFREKSKHAEIICVQIYLRIFILCQIVKRQKLMEKYSFDNR